MEIKPSALAGWSLFFVYLFMSVYIIISRQLIFATQGTVGYIGIATAEILAFGGASVILKHAKPFRRITSLRAGRVRGGYIPIIVAAGFAAAFFSSAACVLSSRFLTLDAVPGLECYFSVRFSSSYSDMPVLFFCLVLIPAVCEELFLRGAVYSLYEPRGSAAAIIISSVALPMIYVDPVCALALLFTGFVCGFISQLTGSAWSAVLIRLITGSMAFAVSWLSASFGLDKYMDIAAAVMITMFFICLFIVFREWAGLIRDDMAPRLKPPPEGMAKSIGGAVRNPGCILFILLYIARVAYMVFIG